MFSTQRLALLWPLLGLCALPAQRSPDEAQRALQEGNQRFASGQSVPQPVGEGVRRTLARGQSPFAVIVTCSDSRVPPEHVFNTGLGELIVVRTAGHVVSPETVAAIEQAVEQLEVPLCVVLGHEHCDVLAAAVTQLSSDQGSQDQNRSQALLQLFERIEPALRKAHALDLGGHELLRSCEEEHAQLTAHECLRRSELLRRYSSVGRFRIVPARYHADGSVEWLPARPLPVEPDITRAIQPGTIPMGLPPHVALRMLRAGHRRFLGDSRPAPDLSSTRREQLRQGEQPIAIVLTDTDSRIAPEHVFDAGLGELFVVRTTGNVLTDESLASIEFAAGELGASLLLVMGHNRCAPVTAAAQLPEHQQLTPNQRQLLRLLEPAVHDAEGGDPAQVADNAGRRNVQRVVHEARSRSALLRALEQQGRFAMLPAFYDLASGDMEWLKDGSPVTAVAAHEPAATGGHAPAGNGGHDAHGAADHASGPNSAHHGHDAHASTAEPSPGHASEPVASHDPHQANGSHDDGHGDGHHGSRGHDALPVIDWESLAAPAGETVHGDAGHGSSDHDTDGNHAEQGAASHSGDAHGTSGHGDGQPTDHESHSPASHGTSTMSSRWSDPVVVVGLGGIASLLVAALLALKSR